MSELYEIYRKHPKVVIDSRQITAGCLFFALKGERFNGNEFAAEALDKGAAFAVVDEEKHFSPDGRHVLVSDTLLALQSLAQERRSSLDFPVLAITGSNGKTTTKELVAQVLSTTYRTYYTKGNLNNHIGVPLTLLAIPDDCEMAVVEMGANHQGEIARLCEIARPSHGLVTNVGKAHLEGFGGEAGVRRGKAELYQFLSATNGTAFVNLDEPYLEELSNNCKYRVKYQRDDWFDHPSMHQVACVADNPYVQVAFANEARRPTEVRTNLIGRYNFNNVMTAITVGRYFKVESEAIKTALESYVPSNNRSQMVVVGTNTYILDAYNANPTSMEAALRHLSVADAPRKMAILGDMLELGEESFEEHQRIYQLALSLGFAQVATFGKEFGRVANESNLHFRESGTLRSWLAENVGENALVLLKGSRGMRMEALLP
jgi:UDP-N-acetylmuramoyl-tripeptide--D-alanyl-D-alanine ligase